MKDSALIPPRLRVRVLTALAAPCVLLALWLPGCNAGDYRVDTGLYAGISKLMADTGTVGAFWFPMLGDAPYFNKPPLAFWVHAGLIRALGMDLWTVRLGTLLAAMLGVFAFQKCVSMLAGRATGLFSAMVLALTLEFFRYTKAFSLDIWFVTFMMPALWVTVAAVRRTPARPGFGRAVLAGAFIGAGLMVKPLYALFLPVAVGVWMLWCAPSGSRARWMVWCAVMGLSGAALAAPWYVSMTLRWGDLFLQEHFIRQTLERAVGSGDGDTAGPGLLYLPIEILRSYWPWMLTLALALATLARRGTISRSPALDRLGLVWTVLLGAGLMAFAGKRSRYLVPIYPALSMLSGAWLACHPPAGLRRHARRAVMMWSPVLPVLALGAALVLPRAGVDLHEPASGEIERLQTAIREAGSPQVWVAPSGRLEAAKLFVKGSPWPRAVGGLPWGQGEFPAKGDIVLYRADAPARGDPMPARTADEPLGKFSGLRAYRVTSAWTLDDIPPATR